MQLKISCGVFALSTRNLMDAMDGANMARKAAKKNGSTAAVVYDSTILEAILEDHREEQKTALALKEKRFVFFLQPKVNLLTGEIIGAEALARRIDADGTIVPPGKFLHIMEANGSIVELDMLIFEDVCAYLADRLNKGLPVVRTSVNLSRLHIENPDAAMNLHTIALKYGIPADLIEFELTETILLHEFEGVKTLIDQLRTYGYHVSIDDFGAGYAGINIWQELHFDTLKLDRRFITDNEPIKARNSAIVPNVINIAQRLNIDVISEGVETEEQCAYLLRLGCTAVQGYYFAKPMPKDQFYSTYTKLNGQYTRTHGRSTEEAEQTTSSQPIQKSPLFAFQHILLLVVCTLFLAACVIFSFDTYCTYVTNMFTASIENNLNSYASGQASLLQAEIEDITSTMSAFSYLIAEKNDAAFIDAYISALSSSSSDVIYLFSTAEEFEARMTDGSASPIDIQHIQRLKQGETSFPTLCTPTWPGACIASALAFPSMFRASLPVACGRWWKPPD